MSKAKIALVIAILILGIILKLHNYSIYPQRGASSDEYTYTFLGISLLKEHVPVSWSAMSSYKNRYNLTIDKLYFPMVQPYFDHPPLNGLLVGGLSILFGQDTFRKVDLKIIRLVPIFLSVISSILVFLLGLRIYGYKTGVLALLIYTTTTIFVMNTRVVFAENLLTPFFLGALYLFLIFKRNLTFLRTSVIALICGLSVLTKELGVAVFLTMFYLFVDNDMKLGRGKAFLSKKMKLIITLCIISICVAGLYLVYGYYYDWNLFWQIVSIQSNREIGPQTLMYILSTPIIVNKIFYDGWYFLGFFSILFCFLEYKENKMIVVPSVVYLFLLIYSLTEGGEMGWYIIPLFPFMALSIAHLFLEGIKKHNWYIFVMIFFVGLNQVRLLYESNFGLTPMQFRIQLIILCIPLVILFLLRKDKLFRVLAYTFFYLFILGNIMITYTYIHPA